MPDDVKVFLAELTAGRSQEDLDRLGRLAEKVIAANEKRKDNLDKWAEKLADDLSKFTD